MNEYTIIKLSKEELTSLVREIISEEVGKSSIPKIPTEADEVFNRKQAAKYLQMSLPTLSKNIRSGKIKCYHIGNNLRFKKSDLLSSLKVLRTKRNQNSIYIDSS